MGDMPGMRAAPAGLKDERTPNIRASRALLGLTSAAVLAVSLLAYDDLRSWSLAALAAWGLVGAGSAYGFVVLNAERGFWAISSVFMLVAICFHEGLLLSPLLGMQPTFEGQTGAWFRSALTPEAAVIATIGLIAFGLIAGLVAAGGEHAPAESPNPILSERFGVAGAAVLAISTGAWALYTARALGPTFMLSSYRAYLTATDGLPMSYIFYGIGLGAVLVAASGSRKWQRRALVVFILFAVAALPIGLRGEVLFPATAAAAIRARSARMPRGLPVVLILLLTLTGVSVLQQIRQPGLGGVSISEVSASPLQGVAELGGSIRTVEAVLSWRAVDGPDSLRHGATYWAPFDRVINGRILGKPEPPAAYDFRLMNVEMRTRETSIGGSFIAEAYRNFGLLGVLLVPGLIGLLLGGFDRWRRTIVRDAVIGVFLVALLLHVRNSFAPTPSQIIIGLIVVFWLSRGRTVQPGR